MKKIIRTIKANTNIDSNTPLLTADDLVQLLLRINELENCSIEVVESDNRHVKITINGTIYNIIANQENKAPKRI